MERATGTEVYGCGSSHSTDITLNIQTTTGGNFSISLNGKNTVENLKKVVSKKLKVSKDRICLLHRERQLVDGTLEDNGLLDGSRVILLPSVETGLLSQRPENSVMQALESLNDTQVNDFLSGKSPLNLTMRLGDHMMLIQLQLSTLNSASSSSPRNLRTSTPTKTTILTPNKKDVRQTPSPSKTPEKDTSNTELTNANKRGNKSALLKQDLEKLQSAFDLFRSMAENKCRDKTDLDTSEESMDTTYNDTVSDVSTVSLDNEQSPIKSLSNLVSSPLDSPISSTDTRTNRNVKSDLLNMLSSNLDYDKATEENSCSCTDGKSCSKCESSVYNSNSDESDLPEQSTFLMESTIDEYPMENLFNSAVDRGLFDETENASIDREVSNLAVASHTQDAKVTSIQTFPINETLKSKRFHYLLHKTSKFKHPTNQNKQKAFMQSVVNKHIKKRMQSRNDIIAQPSTSQTKYISSPRKLLLQPSTETIDNCEPSTSQDTKLETTKVKSHCNSPIPALPSTKALIEASKNLTQTLKKLSKEVLTNKIDLSNAEEAVQSKIGPRAVIESMKHHGKGIYSGTFSGTLNPALQDRYGRPKRDISTIIHILNDLLCATPPITISHKEPKHSCATNTSEDTRCAGCSQQSCPYGQCDGHLPSTSALPSRIAPCVCTDSNQCKCKSRLTEVVSCANCSGKTDGEVCKKCNTAKALALENSKTKCKLEQLRLVMQQKKQRREARKLKTMPYSSSPPKTLGSPEQATAIQEEIETVA